MDDGAHDGILAGDKMTDFICPWMSKGNWSYGRRRMNNTGILLYLIFMFIISEIVTWEIPIGG